MMPNATRAQKDMRFLFFTMNGQTVRTDNSNRKSGAGTGKCFPLYPVPPDKDNISHGPYRSGAPVSSLHGRRWVYDRNAGGSSHYSVRPPNATKAAIGANPDNGLHKFF